MLSALKKAMTTANITKRFSTTCFWPLNRSAMDIEMTPSEVSVNIAIKVNEE